jgi:hypothetical protein
MHTPFIQGFVVISANKNCPYMTRSQRWGHRDPRNAFVFTSEQITELRRLKKRFTEPAVAIYSATYDPETSTTIVDFNTWEDF